MTLFYDAIAGLGLPRNGRPRSDGWSWSLPHIGRGSIDLVSELTLSYEGIYSSQPWVYAAVNKLSRATGMLPLKTYTRGAGMDRVQAFDGPLRDLIRRPAIGITPTYWKQHIVGSTLLYGNAILVKMGASGPDGVPDELLPAPSIGWTLGENDTYVWTSERGERFPFPRWQIIHFKYWHTTGNGFGISALEPLRRTLAVEDAASRLGVSAFKNAAMPASVIETDSKLDDDVISRLRANIERLYGNVDHGFRTAILEQGLSWKPLSHNLNDSAVIDHRKITREEVAAVFDIPQPSIGILDEANFASITALHLMFYQDSLGPWLRMIEETLAVELIDMVLDFQGQFVEFDMGMVLRGDIATRSTAYQRFISSGVYTPNEVRALENMPRSDTPGADDIHLPMNLGPDPAVMDGEN